jgi:hypothetical protein
LGTQGSQGKLGGHNHGTILLTVLLTNFANGNTALVNHWPYIYLMSVVDAKVNDTLIAGQRG